MPVDVLVPPLGTNVDTLTLISWYKQEGDAVVKDEPLFVVETDKATLDVESPASGILRGISAQAGDDIVALSRIAIIQSPGESVQSEMSGQLATPVPVNEAPLSSMSVINNTNVTRKERVFISPRAKRLAETRGVEWQALKGTGPEKAIVEKDVVAFLETKRSPSISPVAQRIAVEAGVDWTQLNGSGPNGKVVREDVTQAIASEKVVAPTLETDEEVCETIPVTGVRAVIANRMAQSSTNTTPVTLTSETDATELVALRSRLIADGVTVSYNDILLSVLARALQEHPRMNASLQGEVIKVWKRVHIGLAVDSEQGLRVPVVRDVNQKGLSEIGKETTALIEASRQGKLLPDAMRGGTFTLTNLGMFGIDAFTPVINLPECGILGVGRIKPQPSVVNDQVVVRQKMWLSLTFDHRLVDGGPAARFLQRVAQLIEKPHLLLS